MTQPRDERCRLKKNPFGVTHANFSDSLQVMAPYVLITGPNGYLGRNLVGCFRRAGWRVGGAGRHRPEGLDWFGPLDLEKDTMPSWPEADLFIHAAYDFSASTPEDIERRNVQQSIRILGAAMEGGAKRSIFVSSMAAHPRARSCYGVGKFKVEGFCHQRGIMVIRPGLLYGAPQGGLTASLAKAVKALPVLPYPHYSQASLYACHVADACLTCLSLADSNSKHAHGKPYIAAAEQPWTFQELLRLIATAQNCSPTLIPIPWRIPWGILRMAEAVGIRLSFRSDSLVSLSSSLSNWDRSSDESAKPFRALTPASFNELSPADQAWKLPGPHD